MARYSIIEVPVNAVKSAGGSNIKENLNTGITFADLSDQQVKDLRTKGYNVKPVSKVSIEVTTPRTIQSMPSYTPQMFAQAMGIDSLNELLGGLDYASGYNIAVIDTGIRETHELINGQVVYSKNFTNDPMFDDFDHGTGVASIISSILPGVGIVNLKVIGASGEGSTEAVVEAIEEVINLGVSRSPFKCDMINLSLGGVDDGDPNDPLRVACRRALDYGIWTFAAAGNGGPNPGTITSPATDPLVYAIGSINPATFEVSEFSSRGPTLEGYIKPEGVMFGEDIVVASSVSDTATKANSGTSFAAPFIIAFTMTVYDGIYYIVESETDLPLFTIPIGEYNPEGNQKLYYDALNIARSIAIKPAGLSMEKDNNYGYGVMSGDILAQVLTGEGEASQSSIDMSMLIMLPITVMMMGMMMKMMAAVNVK